MDFPNISKKCFSFWYQNLDTNYKLKTTKIHFNYFNNKNDNLKTYNSIYLPESANPALWKSIVYNSMQIKFVWLGVNYWAIETWNYY